MHDELVEKKWWISNARFLHALSHAHDAASIKGGVSTRSSNFCANNPATHSEVYGGASLGSLWGQCHWGTGLATEVASFPRTNKGCTMG